MKPTIEEALRQRLPLPWKQSTCDGPPNWKVVRRKPEFFNADIYWQLKKYGMKEDEIRQLFSIRNEDYSKLKQQAGIEAGKSGLANWLADIAPKDRPKIEVDLAPEPTLEPQPDAPPHAPTSAELEDVFRPDDEKPVPFVPVQPPLQARIEIICNGATVYDLEQLHARLFSGARKEVLVSGTLQIVI